MQSRSGNKCHLQCPQQANAIAKPNLRRYLSVWSTAQRRTCRARCRPVCRVPPRRVSPRRVPPRHTCLAVCRRADAYRRSAANASRPARNFVRITTWSPFKIGVYAFVQHLLQRLVVTKLGLWHFLYHGRHKLRVYKKIKCCNIVFSYL